MTAKDIAIARIRELPEPLAREVADFVDFLLVRSDGARWEAWSQFAESLALGEPDMSDYLANLIAYEERLAGGEIRW